MKTGGVDRVSLKACGVLPAPDRDPVLILGEY